MEKLFLYQNLTYMEMLTSGKFKNRLENLN